MQSLLSFYFFFVMIWQFFPEQHEGHDPSSDTSSSPSHSEMNETSPKESLSRVVALSEEQIDANDFGIREAGPGSVRSTLETRGKIILHPDKVAHVLPKIAGVAYQAYKNIGDSTNQNEVIASIESQEIAEVKANYLAALERNKLAESIFEKDKGLYDQKIIPEVEYLQTKSSLEETKINLNLSKQKLQAHGMTENDFCCLETEKLPDLRMYTIRSPISGTVLDRHFCTGEFVESTTPIYEIADLSTVWVEIGIFPKDLNKVKEGQFVEIVLPNDDMKDVAKIIYISPIIQNETIASKAVASLENAQKLWKPGSFVKVNIDAGSLSSNVVVPRTAVREMDGNSFVFVRIPEGFESRIVELGNGDKEHVQITSGLNPGEQYASSNTFLLKADLGKSEVENDD